MELTPELVITLPGAENKLFGCKILAETEENVSELIGPSVTYASQERLSGPSIKICQHKLKLISCLTCSLLSYC